MPASILSQKLYLRFGGLNFSTLKFVCALIL